MIKGRGPVVHIDRSKKARTIEAVLRDFRGEPIERLRTLDIGSGNGGISEHFAQKNQHSAVDVADQRTRSSDAYDFYVVQNERLPFPDATFDIVVSNHVIEHVADQDLHLSEILRVLKPDGCVYLATPNRSSPIMEGHVGNPKVLRYREMASLFLRCGFRSTEYGIAVAKHPEKFEGEVAWARSLPLFVLRLLRPFFPSHIFVLQQS